MTYKTTDVQEYNTSMDSNKAVNPPYINPN